MNAKGGADIPVCDDQAKNTDRNVCATLIDACVMECYFREHMAERDLLFHDLVATHLAKVEQTFLSASSSENDEHNRQECLSHIHATLNAPSHPIRNRLLRLTADSPDLLAIIKAEGKV
jgi:hypothetical protein